MSHQCISPLAAKDDIEQFLCSNNEKPLIVITGPTGAGKTAFSIDVCCRLRDLGLKPRILNSDSRQCYRYLNIGTAKIREDDMQGIPHELLSVLDPKEECTMAWYAKEAIRMIDLCHERSEIPFLVGGSMLFMSAVIRGFQPAPRNDELRRSFQDRLNTDGSSSLYHELLRVDPVTAASLSSNNTHAIIRALEMYYLTGAVKPVFGDRVSPPSYSIRSYVLDKPRDELKRLLYERLLLQYEFGFVQEVESLLDRGYTVHHPGLKSHGYREILACIMEGRDPISVLPVIHRHVCAYAKRSRTWWKREEGMVWVNNE